MKLHWRSRRLSALLNLRGRLSSTRSLARRRRLRLALLVITGAIVAPLLGFSQTAGTKRRQDKRDDRTDRVQQRDDKMVERRDDPIGIRGPERREDHRELRTDRKTDLRERIY